MGILWRTLINALAIVFRYIVHSCSRCHKWAVDLRHGRARAILSWFSCLVSWHRNAIINRSWPLSMPISCLPLGPSSSDQRPMLLLVSRSRSLLRRHGFSSRCGLDRHFVSASWPCRWSLPADARRVMHEGSARFVVVTGSRCGQVPRVKVFEDFDTTPRHLPPSLIRRRSRIRRGVTPRRVRHRCAQRLVPHAIAP